jgi:hypothetical protein
MALIAGLGGFIHFTKLQPETKLILPPTEETVQIPTTGPLAGQSLEQNRKKPPGLSLHGVVDWTTEEPFINIFKTCREWEDKSKLSLDKDGYPTKLDTKQEVACYILTGDQQQYQKPGELTLLLDGSGEVDVWGSITKVW